MFCLAICKKKLTSANLLFLTRWGGVMRPFIACGECKLPAGNSFVRAKCRLSISRVRTPHQMSYCLVLEVYWLSRRLAGSSAHLKVDDMEGMVAKKLLFFSLFFLFLSFFALVPADKQPPADQERTTQDCRRLSLLRTRRRQCGNSVDRKARCKGR